jgi:hypothetical protein
MKTPKMKASIYLIAIIMLIASKAPAQFSANFFALSSVKTADLIIDVDFNITISKNIGELSWSPVSTIDVIRYELEKSTDGEHFNYVTAIAANIASIQQYSIRDNNLTDGINYYRLKIVDNNAKLYYSKPVSVDKNFSAAKFKIMPNIVADELLIWLPVNTQVSNATITDIAGRVVKQNAPINNRTSLTTLNVASLQTGIYKISLVTTDGATTNLSFSKK